MTYRRTVTTPGAPLVQTFVNNVYVQSETNVLFDSHHDVADDAQRDLELQASMLRGFQSIRRVETMVHGKRVSAKVSFEIPRSQLHDSLLQCTRLPGFCGIQFEPDFKAEEIQKLIDALASHHQPTASTSPAQQPHLASTGPDTPSRTQDDHTSTSSPARPDFGTASSPVRRTSMSASSPARNDFGLTTSPTRPDLGAASSPAHPVTGPSSSPARHDYASATSPTRHEHVSFSSPIRHDFGPVSPSAPRAAGPASSPALDDFFGLASSSTRPNFGVASSPAQHAPDPISSPPRAPDVAATRNDEILLHLSPAERSTASFFQQLQQATAPAPTSGRPQIGSAAVGSFNGYAGVRVDVEPRLWHFLDVGHSMNIQIPLAFDCVPLHRLQGLPDDELVNVIGVVTDVKPLAKPREKPYWALKIVGDSQGSSVTTVRVFPYKEAPFQLGSPIQVKRNDVVIVLAASLYHRGLSVFDCSSIFLSSSASVHNALELLTRVNCSTN
ncbi:uncharacterized protein PSANT_03951 [Moesziomyces antarcticus]|nr:uncharacterized protein PSANT_03951 [Moesziomyces antarcticus]